MFLEDSTELGYAWYTEAPTDGRHGRRTRFVRRFRNIQEEIGCSGIGNAECVGCNDVSCSNAKLGDITEYTSMFSGITGKASDWVVAEIQSKVGDFLGMKKRLLAMKGSPDTKTRQKAEKLYVNQVDLEGELSRKTATIDAIKRGEAGWAEAAGLAGFAYKLNSHMDDVNKLDKGHVEADGGPSKGIKIGGYQLSAFQTIALAFIVARFALGLRRR